MKLPINSGIEAHMHVPMAIAFEVFVVAMATVSERFMLFLDNMLNFIIIFYNPQSFINIGKVIQKKFINVAFRYRKL